MIKNTKTWCMAALALLLILLIITGGLVVVIDPYFHYHKPLKSLYYELNNERSQNDGIICHFDYDAMIVGTSMAENFHTSEAEELFGYDFIKVTFAGGTYKEQNDNIAKAIKYNPNLKMVIRPLDYAYLMDDVDKLRLDLGKYPEYLYDNNPFNDVNYIFNKSIIFDICLPMIDEARNGKKPGITSFDDYANWMDKAKTGKRAVIGDRKNFSEPAANEPFTDDIKNKVYENITENVVSLAKANPDVDFYYYITPYSVAWWGGQYELGTVNRWIDIEKYAIELMLECDNIHLYSFNAEFDLTTNLDEYTDECHHADWINTKILSWLYSGTDRLTKENYEDYINQEREFYLNYDYNSLLK